MIVGAAVFVAGITVFFRSLFGVWVGIIAALVQAFLAFFWIFSPYWPAALVIIALDLLVIYALSGPISDEGLRGHLLGCVRDVVRRTSRGESPIAVHPAPRGEAP